MNLRSHEHKDFIRFLISLVLISAFFLLIINSTRAATLPANYVPVKAETQYKINSLLSLKNLDLEDKHLHDYFLANQALFSDDNTKGFYLSELLNSLWISNQIASISA